MATVRSQAAHGSGRVRVAGRLLCAVLAGLAVGADAPAQERPTHWLHAGATPPGAIGRQRLLRGGPLSGYCQPVEIRVPEGARIAPAAGTGFADSREGKLLAGLRLAEVYRFKVTEVPGEPGVELFPTVEVIDRLYPPPGLRLRFPVPVELTRDELLMAAEGKFITRVVYVEDPELAPPVDEDAEGGQRWLEAAPGEDPLVTADHLGRPIAIVRLGGRTPDTELPGGAFSYGSPEPLIYDTSLVPQKKPRTSLPMDDGVIEVTDEPVEPLSIPAEPLGDAP